MGGTTCRACREAIDSEIEIIASKVVAPWTPDEWASGTIITSTSLAPQGFRVPMPPDHDLPDL
jgi:hypothetical protein